MTRELKASVENPSRDGMVVWRKRKEQSRSLPHRRGPLVVVKGVAHDNCDRLSVSAHEGRMNMLKQSSRIYPTLSFHPSTIPHAYSYINPPCTYIKVLCTDADSTSTFNSNSTRSGPTLDDVKRLLAGPQSRVPTSLLVRQPFQPFEPFHVGNR